MTANKTNTTNKIQNMEEVKMSNIDMSQFKIVGHIYQTDNYNLFSLMNGQRPAENRRVKKITKSINEKDIMVPILANDLFQIADGGGRFDARMGLGLPINFIIQEGLTIEDCIRINANQEKWKLRDYVHSYASNGAQEYILLEQLIEKYHKKLSPTAIIQVASSSFGDDNADESVKDGTFKIMMKEDVDERIQFVSEMFDILGKGKGRLRVWCTIFKYLFYSDIINKRTLKKKLAAKVKTWDNKCSYDHIDYALNFVEVAYNAKVRDESKLVDLGPDFRAVKKRFNTV